MTKKELSGAYEARYEKVLQIVACNLHIYLNDLVDRSPRIDRISVRAKSPERFLDKAFKESDGRGQKYSDPLNEVQDQVGARITVFYLSDITRIKDIVLQYFVPIEIAKKEPERNAEFGYFGEHFILKLPDDVVPDGVSADSHPEFFELQIKTLFQHAWSEADHDLAYKSVRALDHLEQREIAFSAAQAWGADRIFEQLAKKLVPDLTRS